MVPLEIEVGGGFCLQGIAANPDGASVAESSVKVVGAGDFVVGRSGVEAGAEAESEPMIGVDIADDTEGVAAVEVTSTPFSVRVVLVLREVLDASRIVFRAC